jgi:hypothetical protein
MPIMKGFYPAVAMKVPPGKSRTECEELVLRFLSTLSWVEERSFMVEGGGLSDRVNMPVDDGTLDAVTAQCAGRHGLRQLLWR